MSGVQDSRPRVMLTHPGKHHHFYQIARAASEHASLVQFRTATYYLPTQRPYRWLARCPGARAATLRARLAARRRFEGISDDAVVSSPYFELAALTLDRVPYLRDWLGRTNLLLAKNALYDAWMSRGVTGDLDLVHSLWGCAWQTFARARGLGVRAVLDVMISPLAHEYVDPEYAASDRKHKTSLREQGEIALADYVFSPSDFVSRGVRRLGFPAERIMHVPYGVAVERFVPRRERSDGEFRILFVGHLALRKGFHYLVEAFREVGIPGAKLTLIGTPVDLSSERLVRENRGLFTWIPHVSYDQLHHHYQQSDIFVFPSLAEGSALVTYEALACGLPAIVTENAGSVVRDGIDGFVVPARDVPSLREAIRKLYTDAGLRRQMGHAARARAEEFSWERYRERVAAAYQIIAAERRA